MMDPTFYILAGIGLAALLIVGLLVRQLTRPVDRFDEYEEEAGSALDEDVLHDYRAVKSARKVDKKSERALQKELKREMKRDDRANKSNRKAEKKAARKPGRSGCEHNWEVTGFPSDRIGTHVNMRCTKCDTRTTVSVQESGELLRERDDVRQALAKSRGNDPA